MYTPWSLRTRKIWLHNDTQNKNYCNFSSLKDNINHVIEKTGFWNSFFYSKWNRHRRYILSKTRHVKIQVKLGKLGNLQKTCTYSENHLWAFCIWNLGRCTNTWLSTFLCHVLKFNCCACIYRPCQWLKSRGTQWKTTLLYNQWHPINNVSIFIYKNIIMQYYPLWTSVCVYFKYNINGRDVQRKNVVNNVDKSSLWAPWQNGPYKNTQNITKHGVYKDATDIKK